MRKIPLLIICLLILLPGAFAQDKPVAILEYFDNETALSISDKEGFPITDIYFGLELNPGTTIRTKKTYAEISLKPNGSIIKISQNTEFKIENLQGAAGSKSNDFAVFTGKVRTIAASVTGNAYTVRTPTAVCGVRGTDFGVEVIPGMKNSVFLKEGKVEFTKNTGESIFVGAGQIADAFADMFSPIELSADELTQMFSDIEFIKLVPTSVPGREPEEIVEAAPAEEETVEQPADDSTEVLQESESENTPEENPLPAKNKILDGLFAFLSDKLGMEMGSVSINDVTYSKFILQPVLTLGKFKAGLYLPVIYTNDLFDPSTWYRPAGNDEWSFGFDQDGQVLTQIQDFTADLMLKIKFIEYGRQRDPFFVKVGNISDITIGHGSIVGGYANDADFPVIRRVGLNLGVDGGKVGFEGMVNDLSEPDFFALRFYTRPMAPVFKLAIGLSFAADLDPARSLEKDTPAYEADPIFVNAGADLDLPIIETDPFSIILFSDVAAMVPYLRNDTDDLDSGFAFEAVYDSSPDDIPFRNYGAMAGVFGRLLVLDYRIDFRLFDGVFKPAFYNATYDRVRGEYAKETIDYLSGGTSSESTRTMGIYGEAGFTLFKTSLKAGYLWPWYFDDDGALTPADDDFLAVSLDIPKGVIPIVNAYGSVSYSRTKFLPTILNGETSDNRKLSLFDENTVLKGELVYGILPTLDLVANISSSVVMNGATIVYEDGKPKMAPSIGVETRIHF